MDEIHKIEKEEDLYKLQDGVFEIIETGEIADIADIRFGYDNQVLTLRRV